MDNDDEEKAQAQAPSALAGGHWVAVVKEAGSSSTPPPASRSKRSEAAEIADAVKMLQLLRLDAFRKTGRRGKESSAVEFLRNLAVRAGVKGHELFEVQEDRIGARVRVREEVQMALGCPLTVNADGVWTDWSNMSIPELFELAANDFIVAMMAHPGSLVHFMLPFSVEAAFDPTSSLDRAGDDQSYTRVSNIIRDRRLPGAKRFDKSYLYYEEPLGHGNGRLVYAGIVLGVGRTKILASKDCLRRLHLAQKGLRAMPASELIEGGFSQLLEPSSDPATDTPSS